jgi:hypothetical protein
VGPGFGRGGQIFADRVLVKVVRFLLEALVGAEAVVAESFLPVDAGVT